MKREHELMTVKLQIDASYSVASISGCRPIY